MGHLIAIEDKRHALSRKLLVRVCELAGAVLEGLADVSFSNHLLAVLEALFKQLLASR